MPQEAPIRRILRRFRPYMKGQGGLMVASLTALLLSTLMRLLEPWPLAFVVDHVLEAGRGNDRPLPLGLDMMSLIWLAAGAVIVTAALRALAGYLSTVGFARIGNVVLSKARNALYLKLLGLSMSFHQRMRSGDLALRLVNDVGQLREVTVSAVLPMLANIFILLGMFIVMFVLNWELALLSLIPLPVMWFSARRSSRLIHEASRRQRTREGSLASTATESMSAIRTVQSLALEEGFSRTFQGSDGQAMNADMNTKKLSAGLERSIDLLVACATALVLWQGALQVMAGKLSAGDLLVFISYLKNSMRPVREYAKYAGRLSKALASGERIADILEETPDITDRQDARPAPPFRGDLAFRDLHFAYHDAAPEVFRGLNLTLAAGEHVAIVGPSGTGKSTLSLLLLRLYDPQQGRIEIDGHDIRNWQLATLRPQIGLLPQDALMFAASIRDNLACAAGRPVSDEEIRAAARLANADGFIDALPDGYDTVIGERGATLSGGQRQRLAIARVALRQCPILILDEPTTGLDRESEAIVRQAIDKLIRNRTTLMITHDLDLAARADRIVFIDQGRIAESGRHDELLARNGPYARLWQLHRKAANRPSEATR
ncbi:MAG: ABC transporter ATP-binding protein [Lautropia sp.]|nr:ABC transporter ATP-binding protein [Lautropia sp.]